MRLHAKGGDDGYLLWRLLLVAAFVAAGCILFCCSNSRWRPVTDLTVIHCRILQSFDLVCGSIALLLYFSKASKTPYKQATSYKHCACHDELCTSCVCQGSTFQKKKRKKKQEERTAVCSSPTKTTVSGVCLSVCDLSSLGPCWSRRVFFSEGDESWMRHQVTSHPDSILVPLEPLSSALWHMAVMACQCPPLPA